MKSKLKRRADSVAVPIFPILLTAIVSIFFLIGCATAPVRSPGEFYMGMIPEESSVFLKIDVEENKELTERMLLPLLGEETLPPDLIKRTEDLYAGISPAGPLLPGVAFAVVGSFPTGIIKMNLNGEEEWERKENGYVYWKSKRTAMELAVPGNDVLCGTNGNVIPMIERYERRTRPDIPMEVRREFDVSDVVVYMPHPGADTLEGPGGDGGGKSGGALDGVSRLRQANIPIAGLWITLLKTEEEYEVSLVFQTSDPDTTKKLVLVSRLLVLSIVRHAGIDDFTAIKDRISITEQRDTVRIEGLKLTLPELENVLDFFSPQS